MDPGHMGRVEKVVDNVKIVAGDIHAATLRAAPCRVIIVRNLEDFVWVGLVGIAHPYPKDAPAVFDRV